MSEALTCDTCGRRGNIEDGIEDGLPCIDGCTGIVRQVSRDKWWDVLEGFTFVGLADDGWATFEKPDDDRPGRLILRYVDCWDDEVYNNIPSERTLNGARVT